MNDIGILTQMFSSGLENSRYSSSERYPPVDIENTETLYKLYIEIPGVIKTDIQIEISGTSFTLSYNRKRSYRPSHAEIRSGKFSRTITLPFSVADNNDVNAQYMDGILTVTIVKPPMEN